MLAQYHPDHHKKTIIPSKYLVWQEVAELTRVTALMDDMCCDSCMAFTGPFKKLDKCLYCFKAHYTDTVHPNRTCNTFLQATTIPIGPIDPNVLLTDAKPPFGSNNLPMKEGRCLNSRTMSMGCFTRS
jgi:hypothetical protein